MNMNRLRMAAIAMLAVMGCSFGRGFDVGALDRRLGSGSPQVTNTDIQKILDLKPQLRFPASVLTPKFGD
jgi:hypothetical protein